MVLAQAVKHVPNEVKLWLAAVRLETDAKAKEKVLQKGLEFIPNSVKLWRYCF